jgi:glycosyl hydrolase family 16
MSAAQSSACLVLALVLASVPTPSAAEPGSFGGPCTRTAAELDGWGSPDRSDDFNDSSSLDGWHMYDSVGHAGNGKRTPDAVSVVDGVMTITGDANGNSEGMAWLPGQLYGRWEACVSSPHASPNYHSVALLWPDSENWPDDGEIDFMEIVDPSRQNVTASVLHVDWRDRIRDRAENFHTQLNIDATQWHSWAVEWTPTRVAGFVDGAQWFSVTDHVPQGPMHLCIQLDNFGGDLSQGGQQLVDWVRQYPLT